MPEEDSGRLPDKRRRSRRKDAEDRQDMGIRGYAQAVQVIDGGVTPQDLAGEIIRDGVLPADSVTGLILAIRDVLRLRGWLDEAPIVVDRAALLQSWSPRLQDEPPRMRLVLDLENMDVTQVAALWRAQQQRLPVTVRLMSRQLALGEAPAAQDLDALMAAHDGAFHEEQPDWACPTCLLRAAEERLAEQPDEGTEPPPGEEGPPAAPEEST